ncbi:hypothetical protein HYV86_00465 [Candidatus Woesearchaeota archaeon]|nr:hypothetical protein [Candidatus Woesearchaeota archaeon]
MSAERISQLREQIIQLEKRLRQLEWDLARNQINVFQKKKLDQLRAEHTTLSSELASLESVVAK